MEKYDSSTTDQGFLKASTDKFLIIAASIMALVYFVVLAFVLPKGHPVLFWILVAGEVFHLWQIISYAHTVWGIREEAPPRQMLRFPHVDVYVTVAGEPLEIVKETLNAAKDLDYPNFKVYVLNDGFVAQKENWRDVITLAQSLGLYCITRTTPGGAKAGNINNALKLTHGELIAVFDADQVPKKDFLSNMTRYFSDHNVGFVQSPQYYKNHSDNEVTAGAWEQQELFFGPISRGKSTWNSAFLCGTNMVIRRDALLEVGGMPEDNIAEDFLTSLFLHQKGWKSVYVPKVLAEGLAPQDLYSYYKQQLRWARGSLEIMFKYNPLFRKNLTWHQKMEYLASSSYYLSGIIVLANALLPLIFFYTGLVPLASSTMMLALIFLPYIFLVILVLRLSSSYAYSFRALAFSMSSFAIQLQALAELVLRRKTKFTVTSKKQLKGNYWYLSFFHLAYIAAVLLGFEIALLREGLSPQVFTNLSWALFNVSVFVPFIIASMPLAKAARENEGGASAISN